MVNTHLVELYANFSEKTNVENLTNLTKGKKEAPKYEIGGGLVQRTNGPLETKLFKLSSSLVNQAGK